MLQSHVPLTEDAREPTRVNVWKPDHYKEYREKRTRHENIKMGYQQDIAEAWTAGKHKTVLQVYERSRYVMHLLGTDNIHRPEIATTVCDVMLLLTSLAELSSLCKYQEKCHVATIFLIINLWMAPIRGLTLPREFGVNYTLISSLFILILVGHKILLYCYI